jgi:hypothetical protein
MYAEPHCYDLCSEHSERLTAPRGWEVVRLDDDIESGPSSDELAALADAVREVGLSYDAPPPVEAPVTRPNIVELRRRGHLTVLADPDA